MEKGYLTTHEFAKRVGASEGGVYQRARNGKFSNIKKEPNSIGSGFKWLIHESEIENYHIKKKSTGHQNGLFDSRPGSKVIEADEFKDIELSKLKSFKPEKGTIAYRNLATAVAMAYERKSWEEILVVTNVKRKFITVLIEEMQRAEENQPGKYKTTMDYLYADRPYSKDKEVMSGKKGHKK